MITLLTSFLFTAILLFPTVKGRNLEGEELLLPKDFVGKANLLFVAFKRVQQAEVDTWNATAQNLKISHPNLQAYELPVLNTPLKLIRGMIDGGMRWGIPDSTVRAHTITIYTNTEDFRAALNIPAEDHIQVLLLDVKGAVVWRTSGPMNEQSAKDLTNAVTALLKTAD